MIQNVSYYLPFTKGHSLRLFSRSLFVVLLALSMQPAFATVYNCSTLQQIRDAMASAVAGDEIVIAAGTYTATNTAGSGTSAHFYGGANGTASNPITIRSASSSNKAVLSGSSQSSLTVLRIVGDYWIVKDLKITNAQKGLIFDNANYCKAENCEVYDVGYEGIHVRDGSDHTTIDGCNIHHTGTVSAGFGEGIYIGTDKGSWSSYDPYVEYTTVKNCTIGPYVAAEALDIKEGSSETVVEYCSIDATGISGANYADSFIDLKGIRTYVRYNTFNRNNASNLTVGIAAIDRSVALSCYEHAIHDNTFNMDITSGNMVEAYSGTSDVYAWNNTRNPSGSNYNSSVITSCCPSWYNPSGTCSAPSGLSTSGITSSSVTFNWGSVSGASNYDLQYRVNGTSTWTSVNNLTGTSYTQSGLSASTTYQWQIRTDCGTTQSSYTAGSNFTTSAASTCNAPSGLSTSNITSSSVTFSWSNVSGASNYDLQYRVNGTSTWTSVNNLTSTSHNQTGLSASTTYQWQVRTDCGTTQSSYTSGSNFTTSSSGGGGSTTVVYSDALATDWNNYSYSGTYDFANTTNVQVGTKSIKATYGGWGGVLIKKGTDLDLSGISSIRFWVKGEGSYLIRLRLSTNLGNKDYEFTTSTSWQQISLNMSTFGNPSTLESITLQSRNAASGRIVYYDQIEFVGGGGSLIASPHSVTPFISQFNVYPNPMHGNLLQLELRETGMSGEGTIQLLDITGKMIWQDKLELDPKWVSRQLQLPINPVAGVYLLRIENATLQLQQRIVVR